MEELEIIGTFESEETARNVAKALNRWFTWLMEDDRDEVPEIFEDFGLTTDDYNLDRDGDIDWPETPRAKARGSRVVITVETSQTVDMLQELLEALGAYEVDREDENE